jgi:valyl-tRNA synthetase
MPHCLILKWSTKKLKSRLTYIKYPLAEEDGFVTVATTRPETMLGDSAVAVARKTTVIKTLSEKAYCPHKRKILLLLTVLLMPPLEPRCESTPSHDFNDEAIAKRQSPASLYQSNQS